MILASFEFQDKQNKPYYFQEIFLITDITVKIVLSMFFPIFSNANILFSVQKLTSRSYSSIKAINNQVDTDY